jgi:hypothetical protein
MSLGNPPVGMVAEAPRTALLQERFEFPRRRH